MSGINSLPSERAAIIATIDPDNFAAAGANNSDYFDMSKFDSAMAILMVGDIAAGDIVDMKVTQSTDSGGTGEKDITSAAITQVVSGSPLAPNLQYIINLRATDFDMDNDFRWGRVVVTLSDSASPLVVALDLAALVLGFDPKEGPASDNDLSSVTEIVSL